ncbi:thermonuclease family protein [Sulfurimonas sp. HSL-1716]|uniref:thermonuclease family protein n=1 Tax=Hydrocurvibacter sulfurireducens TaxID=3131937 RepID=UPI0031F8272A
MIFFTLNAQSIQIAELRSVYSNDMQKFSIKMNSFICEPYGVVTLEEILADKNTIPICKKRIEEYFSKNPVQKYFIQMNLHLRQNYHIEFKDKRCLVYAFGQKTISEALLEQGLAIKKPSLKDDEFGYLFLRAQTRAKNRNSGIWSDKTLQSCVKSFYK